MIFPISSLVRIDTRDSARQKKERSDKKGFWADNLRRMSGPSRDYDINHFG